MGECGCGAFAASYQLPGPDGTVYAIQKAHACPDCETPHGVVIHRFSKRASAAWGVHELPVLDFQTLNGKDFDGQSRGIAVVSAVDLWQALERYAAGDEFERTVDEDGLRDALAESAFAERAAKGGG